MRRHTLTDRLRGQASPGRQRCWSTHLSGGHMNRSVVATALILACVTPAFSADNHGHDHAVPTLKNQTTTSVTIEGNTVTLTFGPIDLPSPHDGDLAASMPKHTFQLPKDMYLI